MSAKKPAVTSSAGRTARTARGTGKARPAASPRATAPTASGARRDGDAPRSRAGFASASDVASRVASDAASGAASDAASGATSDAVSGAASGADSDALLRRLLERLDALLPAPTAPDWNASIAYRWRRHSSVFGSHGRLEPVAQVAAIRLDDLKNVDDQKALVEQNTRQFVCGLPANNVLLTGSRGTGKSSLIKACLNAYADRGLRLIEVDKDDLVDLPDIVAMVAARPERFVVFCDDLSFEEGEPGYKALKVALDGSVAAQSDNLLIYATSNRRHLMPEYMRENLAATYQEDGQIHPGETTEEKISLSERFGLWVSFYPFRQDDYLAIVAHWLATFGCTPRQVEAARADALRFALERGSRSGRVAWQFARDWSGRQRLRRRARGD